MDLYFNLLNSINSGVIYADDDHIVRYMDDTARSRFNGMDFVGKSLIKCHRDASVVKILDYYQQMKEGRLEEVFVRKTPVGNAYMKVVKDEAGRVIGYMERTERQSLQPKTALKENLYQRSAALYDAFAWEKMAGRDVDFYLEQIPVKASVLEIGCGTGRVGLKLATRGNRVLGVDLSQEMIHLCNAKIVEHLDAMAGRMKTRLQDMQQLETGETYDCILFPYRVFQMLLTDKARRQCLERVRRHLKPEGRVIIDMFQPVKARLDEPEAFNGTVRVAGLKENGDELFRETRFERHFEKQQIVSFKYAYEIRKKDGSSEKFEEPMRLSYMEQEQAAALFEACGFEIVGLFGDYDGGAIDPDRPKEMLFILK